ncbi:hypothetical protein BLS_009833 [Venturia inaequalis]|uniref:Mtf2-like C-terminal domain-containing protein n=1 Tax=Venturia inaequalis TaxID=5025 RepID=A0A8H3UY19_VENIN|nr:hypothetical protein EG328_004970 [Venturia inaequalis]KAE9979412.1 hypothetical protein BLS_009833 [Venturia inaequalis]KAE9991173.1 hypothetical protein EG327_000355 [Venturia inaequalis]RDI77544.1 hypothetical protein Vi05172_g12512 [Venturia inaequalis]
MRAAALRKSWRRPLPIPPNGSLTPFLFQTRTILGHPEAKHSIPRIARRRAGYAASRLVNYGSSVLKDFNVEPLPSDLERKRTKRETAKPAAASKDGRSQSRSKGTPSSTSKISAKPQKTIKERDEVPFEGTNIHEPGRPYKSTITREEKEAFARLFDMVLTDSGDFKRKNAREGTKAQSVISLQDGETAEPAEPKPVSIQDEDFPEHFPGPLKRMAAEASRKVQEKEEEARLARELEAQGVDKIAREKAEAERLASDPQYQQQVAQKDRIEALLAAANTDVELWNVLETELFSPIQLLDLDKKTADLRLMASVTPRRAKMSTETINSHREDHVAIITYIYPVILRTALDHLIKRFPASTLPFSILPRIKRLGRTSYILGASTSLYNEIINLTYKIYADFHRIDELFREFDPAGLEFDNQTLEILEGIERVGRRGMQGREGVNMKLFWNMDITSDGWRKVINWIPTVRERLEQEVVRVAEENARINAEIYEEEYQGLSNEQAAA